MLKNEKSANRNDHQNRKTEVFCNKNRKTDLKNSQNRKTENPNAPLINHKIVDPEGRYIILKACIQDKVYVLINVYAPSKDKDQVNFFNKLLSILQNENLDSVDNIILGGDLNCQLDPLLDKKRRSKYKKEISYLLCRRFQK